MICVKYVLKKANEPLHDVKLKSKVFGYPFIEFKVRN